MEDGGRNLEEPARLRVCGPPPSPLQVAFRPLVGGVSEMGVAGREEERLLAKLGPALWKDSVGEGGRVRYLEGERRIGDDGERWGDRDTNTQGGREGNTHTHTHTHRDRERKRERERERKREREREKEREREGMLKV